MFVEIIISKEHDSETLEKHIHNIYKSIKDIKNERIKNMLIENKDNALMSRELVTIDINMKINERLCFIYLFIALAARTLYKYCEYVLSFPRINITSIYIIIFYNNMI